MRGVTTVVTHVFTEHHGHGVVLCAHPPHRVPWQIEEVIKSRVCRASHDGAGNREAAGGTVEGRKQVYRTTARERPWVVIQSDARDILDVDPFVVPSGCVHVLCDG